MYIVLLSSQTSVLNAHIIGQSRINERLQSSEIFGFLSSSMCDAG
jgi:hypothetical protein